MYFQSTGRNQRPRGFNVKLVFQFALVLAVCVWLLYQIKHSNNRKDVMSLQAKFSKRNGVVILGRKGDKGMYKPDSNEAEGKHKDGGGGDDELDGNVDEKMEPAIPHDQPLSNNGYNEFEMRDMDKEVFSEENSQRIASSLEVGDERHAKETHEDEGISIDALKQGKEITKLGNGTENGLSEIAKELHGFGFRDENGVPQGGNDLVEFTLAKSLNHPSRITKSSQN